MPNQLAHFAEVGVDADTAEVRLRRMLGVFAAGRIFNAKTARSQLIGGMTFGVSSVLHEEALVEPRTLMIHFLREQLNLTGPHIGCDTSHCGACTVDLNGKSVKSCTMFAVQAEGREILTIEGLAQNGKLDPLQEAFWNEHALQCGFCTPGMILASCDLLSRNANPSDAEIRHGIDGNLCRCTGYQHIVSAVQNAASKMKEAR